MEGNVCSETSWKAQNLRRTQTAATVEGVTQTAKQDFKLYSQTIYPGKVSPNLEKNETTMARALMWSYCYHSDLYNIILGQCTALLHCLLLHKSLLLPAFHTLQMFFFLFFSNKIQVSLICSQIRRLSRYSQHADADGAPTYSLKRSINFKWLPYISLIALVSSHISIWGPAGGLVRCAIIKVQSYIGVK